MDSRTHPAALLDIDTDLAASSGHSDGPAFRRIARQLKARIDSGALRRGTRLPPTRELARRLGVARNSIVDAYDELIADGLLEGRGRRGTFVTGDATPGAASPVTNAPRETPPPTALQRHSVRRNRPDAAQPADAPTHAAFDWRPGQANARALPIDAWRAACREAGRTLPPQGYGDPRGDASLRQAIADWLQQHRSVRVTAAQIVVTHGTGQALHLIARTLLQSGDRCVAENPGYAGATLAFDSADASTVHVPVDAHGLCVEPAFDGDVSPVMLHVTPTHQYPMGARLSGPRRRTLIDAARAGGTLILENEYDCEFNYAGTDHPPLFSHAPDSTLLLSTFAKAVSPSLRLGFIAAPPDAADALAACVERERMHVSWPAQKIVEALLVSGELDRHLRRIRRHYASLRASIRARFDALDDARLELLGDDGGVHVVIRGRTHDFDLRLQTALRDSGVVFDRVVDFATGDIDARGVLLAYGHMDAPMLDAALMRLQSCVAQLDAR
ncbi:PLP-dependent aminotransferase family protein [Paraburkholderia sp.]|uniref:MocR-like pyridoxine biosynthesis transcription factor PdxR n=1 Tax=Paraburkholderia sp. TaxID=1926495 RepID=UPI0023A21EF3|nr:PLP-dependent aminotransferase family protein [Paraburkholderia sp.]MDE1179248.1 PLP-dependent aminotransferase family protein [Paraburkholderia sp.]